MVNVCREISINAHYCILVDIRHVVPRVLAETSSTKQVSQSGAILDQCYARSVSMFDLIRDNRKYTSHWYGLVNFVKLTERQADSQTE
jgi:hypothetical protein